MFKHILVPTDGSDLSASAARLAGNLARTCGARLTVFHAMPEPPFPVTNFGEDGHYDPDKPKRFAVATQERAQAILDAALAAARESGVAASSLLATGDVPYDEIIRAVEAGACDLVVMASHGRRGLDALLLGSETHKVLTHCKVPVLVCR